MDELNHLITAAFAGDIVFDDRIVRLIDSDGIDEVARRLWEPFESVDLALVNLEAPVTDQTVKRENKKYNLKIPQESLSLFDNRFVLSLANNHIMDFGGQGLTDTIESLNRYGIRFAGAGINLEEAKNPVIIERDNLTIGIICAADPRYQPADSTTPGTNPAEPEMLKEALRNIKAKVDIIIVSLHIGMEFIPVPTPFMTFLAELCLGEGASVVQFHHAHCVSGFSLYEGKVVLWGTGNYAFPGIIPKGYKEWSKSAVWKMQINAEGRISGEVVTIPVVISDDGIPSVAVNRNYHKILKAVMRRSRKVNNVKKYRLWRAISIMRPGYLQVSLSNYMDIARRGGLKALINSVKASVNVLFRRSKM